VSSIMSFSEKLVFICIYLLLETCIIAYKPVVIIHGVLSGNVTMIPMAERIKQVSFALSSSKEQYK
jgi:uncharacterized membrane protein